MIPRKIALSAGHSNTKNRDNGAVIGNAVEGAMAVEFRRLVARQLKARYNYTASVDKDDSVTSQTVSLFRQYFGLRDILVDFHFNSSSNAKATGVEVIVPKIYSLFEYELGSVLSKTISDLLSIPNRRVKTELETARKKLMFMTLQSETILVEICFISNPKDLATYEQYKEDLADEVAMALYNARQKK